MARRKRNQNRSRIWRWISFAVFAAILSLLSYSVIQKKSPAEVLQKLFSKKGNADPLLAMSKSELREALVQNQSELAKTQELLELCQSNDGYTKGVISTSSNSLNMRSEASLDGSILMRIPNGSSVSILYYDDEELFLDGSVGRWCRIKYADQEGWVWGNYIDELNSPFE